MDEFKCDACGKTFISGESLEQHNQSKHSDAAVSPPKKGGFKLSKKHYFLAAAVFALFLLAFWAYSSFTAEGKYDSFAQCLTEKDVTFYGAFWCPNCASQKAMFGKSAKLLPYVECSTSDRRGQVPVCVDAGIEAYPTWDFANASRQVGVLSLQQLSRLSGCPLSS